LICASFKNRPRLISNLLAVAGLGLLLAGPHPARANGAFPDEMSIHFPASAPHRILLATNFGLAVSEDDGATWRYACEPYVTGSQAYASLYQVASDGAVLATSGLLTRSADVGCTWTPAAGDYVSGTIFTDAFPDPNDASFVLATVNNAAGSAIHSSHDGGRTFGPPLYTSADILRSIEISRSARGVFYATLLHPAAGSDPGRALLLRSTDSGAHWSTTVISAPPGTEPRIAAVDPVDSNVVYLRLLSATSDAIAITTDGGATVPPPALMLPGEFLSSFLRADDGSLYAGTAGGRLYVRRRGETSFAMQAGPRLRCLGQRQGTSRIFACGDMFLDSFSVGYSDDGGRTFQPLMKLTQLAGLLTCPSVQNACAAHWAVLQQTLGIGAPVNRDGGSPSPPPSVGGSHCSGVGPFGLLLLIAWVRRFRKQS
jgi:photosystem II stability/assembly factor-like uncharacterized protein